MTKPYCEGCRFYKQTTSGQVMYAGWCTHKDAKVFHRVNGYRSPDVAGPLASPETLEKCDENGWFEEKTERRKWWQIFT